MARFRVGADIGGTFTDIVLIGDGGERCTRKVSSTVDNYARAIVDGIAGVLADRRISAADIVEILHGTTVASNAILELKGARTGLITTRGFRDVLEIRTLRSPRLYDLTWSKPPDLVPRHLRVEVDERIDAKGAVDRPLDIADAERAVRRLLDEGVEAIAVCLLHSYLNPLHERTIKAVVTRMAPELTLCISSEVLPEIKEYERTSTTVINAYVRPLVERYVSRLVDALKGIGVESPLHLMQSNGGLTTATSASLMPMNIIESGPAAGVVGVQALAWQTGIAKAISFDMGGTTAKASLIEDGNFTRAMEYSVGGGIIIGSRLMTGAGYTLKVPAIDLAEVGAGGGSIIWIDSGGALKIGPQSAGASPGPVCYDSGGEDPTVTDANVVLGYVNPEHLVDGALKLNADKSRAVIAERIAAPLGLSLEQAAYGAHVIAASNMIRAIRAVSSERGRDPRAYTLVGFGGNGPIFAATMAQTLLISRVVIPPSAGVFSALGLLCANVEYHVSRTRLKLVRQADPGDISTLYRELENELHERLRGDGFAASQISMARSATLHYQGQSDELEVKVPAGTLTREALAGVEEAFNAEHERTYGHRAGAEEPIEFVSLRVLGRGLPVIPRAEQVARAQLPRDVVIRRPVRRAYFGASRGWLETRVINRSRLATPHPGPCIVEEYDSTCLVPPGCTASLDRFGNVVIAIEPATAAA